MKLEFITIKDPHLSFGFQNRIRHNYEKNILAKLEFIKGYCKSNWIKYLICTGDVFDSSTEDKWSFKKYRKNKRVIESLGINNGVEIYSNVGNHDMFHGFEGHNETVFGEMVHDGFMKNITNSPLILEEDNSIIKVQGIDFSVDNNIILENLRVFDEEIIPGKIIYKVAVLHSNITPDEVTHVTDFTYKSLIDTFPDIDMFICGHYHLGYPTTEILREDGKSAIFINNWNLTRVVRDYEVQLDEHTPEFEHVIISYDIINHKFITDIKNIKIPFVPYKDAFIDKVIDILRKSKQEIFNFFSQINFADIKEDSKSTDEELLEKIKTKNKFSDLGVLTALQYLNNAKE